MGHGMGLILVVDDDPAVRRVLSTMLQASSHRTVEAADGCEALSLYQSSPEPFSLVITDVTMPVMDGLELVKQIRELDPAAKTIIMSSCWRGPDEGVKEFRFLPKPFTPRTVREIVTEVLGEAA